jgi:hypothetical protein
MSRGKLVAVKKTSKGFKRGQVKMRMQLPLSKNGERPTGMITTTKEIRIGSHLSIFLNIIIKVRPSSLTSVILSKAQALKSSHN